MARKSKPRISDEEAARIALAEADEAKRALMTMSLEGIFHHKKILQPTLNFHNRLKKLWGLFSDKFYEPQEGEMKLAIEIVPGAALPPQRAFKEFVRWLGYTLQGRIEKFVVKGLGTIQGYIFTLFAVWNQYAGVVLSKEYRQQILAFFHSREFDDTSKLSTKSREKPIADVVDVAILILGILRDKKVFKTQRSRIDAIYATLICCLSSERIGALVESSSYRKSNEALTWGDHEFWALPNPAAPRRPRIALVLKPQLLKGFRYDDSKFKMFCLLAERADQRETDAMMYSLVSALKDDIFVGIKTADEIFFPEEPCTIAHKLTIKESAKTMLVFRKTVFEEGRYTTSDTLAMPYGMATRNLREVGLRLGFEDMLTWYCFRRCSANNLNASVSQSDRELLMGHTEESGIFSKAYQSRMSTVDLSAVLAGRHEENEVNTDIMKTIRGMSKTRDENAPISLNAAERMELFMDEELVEFRAEKAKLPSLIVAFSL
ncbi:hypothetical protein FB45DRAFT_85510 [Roridomyces roridus]|uniref:Uncharacterized protein n=1 Tax=Roridomyces roridus TaxID=1738132 RepID=A0AAD7BLT2_9AGAR|nr:hypothetical protein FB45DRAFT_85510 [Roridomyces roridus]